MTEEGKWVRGHSPKRPPKVWNIFKPSSFILKFYTYFVLHYNNFLKKITHHHATSGRCSIFSLCHTLGQWILRPWLFILLHNFRNILFPVEFRFTSGYLLSLYYLFWKKRLKIGSIIEPKTQFSTFLIIQQGHASFLFNACSETLDMLTRITKTIDQASRSRKQGCGAPALLPAHFRPAQHTPTCWRAGVYQAWRTHTRLCHPRQYQILELQILPQGKRPLNT